MFSSFFKWGVGLFLAVGVMFAWGETFEVSTETLTSCVEKEMVGDGKMREYFLKIVTGSGTGTGIKDTELTEDQMKVIDADIANRISNLSGIVSNNIKLFFKDCCKDDASCCSKQEDNGSVAKTDRDLRIMPSFIKEFKMVPSAAIDAFGVFNMYLGNIIAGAVFGERSLANLKDAYAREAESSVPTPLNIPVANIVLRGIVKAYENERMKRDTITQQTVSTVNDVVVLGGCREIEIPCGVIENLLKDSETNVTGSTQGFDCYNLLASLKFSSLYSLPDLSKDVFILTFKKSLGGDDEDGKKEREKILASIAQDYIKEGLFDKETTQFKFLVKANDLKKLWTRLETDIQDTNDQLSCNQEKDENLETSSEKKAKLDADKLVQGRIAFLKRVQEDVILEPMGELFAAVVFGGILAEQKGLFVMEPQLDVEATLAALYSDDLDGGYKDKKAKYLKTISTGDDDAKTKRPSDIQRQSDIHRWSLDFVYELFARSRGTTESAGDMEKQLKLIMEKIYESSGANKEQISFSKIMLELGYESTVRGLCALGKVQIKSPDDNSGIDENDEYSEFEKVTMLKKASNSLQCICIAMTMGFDDKESSNFNRYSKSVSIQNVVTVFDSLPNANKICFGCDEMFINTHFKDTKLFSIVCNAVNTRDLKPTIQSELKDEIDKVVNDRAYPFFCARRHFLAFGVSKMYQKKEVQ